MSASMRPTRCPARASATATLADTVDLPTPPFPDEIARTLPRCGSSTGVEGGGTPAGAVRGAPAAGAPAAALASGTFTPTPATPPPPCTAFRTSRAREPGWRASRLSERALIAPAVADAQPLPADVAASDARWRTDAEQRADARSRTIDALNLVAFACTAVLWLVWLYRAYTNLVFVGSKRVRFSPTWAVGYWFIPFVNVVRAYQVMKDLWLRSDSRNDRDGYDDLPAPVLLRGWWGMSLAWAVLEPVFTRLARDARTAEQLSDATHVGIAVGASASRVVSRKECALIHPPNGVRVVSVIERLRLRGSGRWA